uniref:Calponin-homology (CH) domain-containing protein n=1 Tax=Strongyloides stercoralis TaxID=6248 RepID=A0A0K0EMY7_STRER
MDETILTNCDALSSTMNASTARTPRSFFKDADIDGVVGGNGDSTLLFHETHLQVNMSIEDKRNRMIAKLNKKYNKESTIKEEDEVDVCTFGGHINDNKENVDFESRRRRRIASLERRNKLREKAVERLRMERLEKETHIDVLETTKKFLGETSSTTLPGMAGDPNLTVTYMESILSTTKVFSETLIIEPKEEIEKRNAMALASWINHLIGVSKDSCEDINAFSERARNKADEILRNALKNPEAPSDVVVNLNESSGTVSRKRREWMESVTKARQHVKSADFLNKIKDMVENNPSIVLDNLKVYADIGLQREVVSVLLNFSPVWLRLAIECIYNVDLNILDYGTSHNIFISFVTKNIFSNPRIVNSKKFCPTGTKASLTQSGMKVLQRHFITKIIQIIAVIEYLVKFDVIKPENPPVFSAHSPIQSSKDFIVWIRRTFVSMKFDLTKALTKIGLVFKYEQTYHDNYSFVVKDIEMDLCDGFILAKVVERIFKVNDKSLLLSLRPPNGDRLRKIGNVKVVLNFIKDRGIDIGNLKAEDIVQGKMGQIIELLWKLVGVFETQKDQYEVFRRMSRMIRKLSSHLDDPCCVVPRYLDGFDIILHVARQFSELVGSKVYKSIEEFGDGDFLISFYNYFVSKYNGLDGNNYYGNSSMAKIFNIACDEMGISKDLASLNDVKRGDCRTFKLFVKLFMEKCFLVTEVEESALTLQRFFRNVVLGKKKCVVNLEDYSSKWYEEQKKEKMAKDMAASKIQAAFKGYKARRQFLHIKTSLRRVQACVRGFIDRRRASKLRHRMVSSALVIQRAWRKFLFRRSINKAIEKKKIENNFKREEAARVIQRSWRCYKAKTLLKELQMNRKIEEKSARLIQSAYRAYRNRKNIKNNDEVTPLNTPLFDKVMLKDSVERFRERLAVFYLNKKRSLKDEIEAAIKIQAWYRGASVRRKLSDEIRKRKIKMEKLGKEVAMNKNLDVEDLKIPVNSRFYRICQMLDSGKIRCYLKPFLELARLLRYSPSLGIHFVLVNGHKSLSAAIGRLKRSPLEQEVNSLFSEVLYYLLSEDGCYKFMKSEIANISGTIWHYFYAHYTNVDVVHYLGHCILILKKKNAPPECFEKANFYIDNMTKRFASLPKGDKRFKIIKKLQSAFKQS